MVHLVHFNFSSQLPPQEGQSEDTKLYWTICISLKIPDTAIALLLLPFIPDLLCHSVCLSSPQALLPL